MRFYTIRRDGRELACASPCGKMLYPLPFASSLNDLIVRGVPVDMETLKTLSETSKDPLFTPIPVEEADLLAPIPHPLQDVVCLGLNYASHQAEAARFSELAFGGERPYPIFFAKRVNTAPGPGGTIPSYPGLVEKLDYECELAVVLGRDAFQVAPENVKDYIFGYTVLNDVSARTLQTRHKQWYFGKSLDGFTPMGPCIVTADEFAYPPALPLRCLVNGEIRQDSNTENLITTIDEIVSILSQGMTLKAGTIIATGTPAGVGMGMQPPTFLQPGDVVECEIEGIGSLVNYVR